MTDELPYTPKSRPCEWCGAPVDQLGTRSPRLYCKRSHRQRAFEARRKREMELRLEAHKEIIKAYAETAAKEMAKRSR